MLAAHTFTQEKKETAASYVLKIIEDWDISDTEVVELLEVKSLSTISQWNEKKFGEISNEQVERFGHILAIYVALKKRFRDPLHRAHWLKGQNKAFHNRTPLDIMTKEGVAGLVSIRQHLTSLENLW